MSYFLFINIFNKSTAIFLVFSLLSKVGLYSTRSRDFTKSLLLLIYFIVSYAVSKSIPFSSGTDTPGHTIGSI